MGELFETTQFPGATKYTAPVFPETATPETRGKPTHNGELRQRLKCLRATAGLIASTGGGDILNFVKSIHEAAADIHTVQASTLSAQQQGAAPQQAQQRAPLELTPRIDSKTKEVHSLSDTDFKDKYETLLKDSRGDVRV